MKKLSLLLALMIGFQFGYAAESSSSDVKADVKAKAATKVDKAIDKSKPEIERFWITPEFLLFGTKDGPVHDLIVNRVAGFGFPTNSNTASQRIFSNDDQEYGLAKGGRLTFGAWVDHSRQWGFELSGFALEKKKDSWNYIGTDNTTTGISFFNTSLPAEDSLLINVPGSTGTVGVSSSSQLWGAEGSGLYNLKRNDKLSLDFTFGVRHLDLKENLQLKTESQFPFGTFSVRDEWEASNKFYGAKFGAKLNLKFWNRLLVDIAPSVTLGANRESLDLKGSTNVLAGGTLTTLPGGLFTTSTNLGDYDRTRFAVVPEIKLGLGCKITKMLSFHADYNFLYVSNVVRPGEQINRSVNPANLGVLTPVAPLDPQPRFKSSDYWAHGLSAGFTIKF